MCVVEGQRTRRLGGKSILSNERETGALCGWMGLGISCLSVTDIATGLRCAKRDRHLRAGAPFTYQFDVLVSRSLHINKSSSLVSCVNWIDGVAGAVTFVVCVAVNMVVFFLSAAVTVDNDFLLSLADGCVDGFIEFCRWRSAFT